MKALAAIICLAAPLTACSTPTYVDRSSDATSLPSVFNVVEFEINDAFWETPPDCLLVMPFAIAPSVAPHIEEQDAQAIRAAVYAHLSKQSRRLIRPDHVDQALADTGEPVTSHSAETRCGYAIEGTITEYGSTFLGVYSSVSAGAALLIVRTHDDVVLWRGSHIATIRGGGLPFGPIGILTNLVAAIDNVQSEQELRVTEDLARRLVSTIPEESKGPDHHLVAETAGNWAESTDYPESPVTTTQFEKEPDIENAMAAVATRPGDPRALSQLGHAYNVAGEPAKGLAAYQIAITFDRDNGQAWDGAAQLYLESGDIGKASWAFYRAARSHLSAGDIDAAKRVLQRYANIADARDRAAISASDLGHLLNKQ